jgi:NAD(P)-dependent dehydrogenase (short-subunit alcohol dehydrogenase family)
MEEKLALITGASKGIGAATAKVLARRGHFVCINYHESKDAAEDVASQIIQSGGRCVTVGADISKEDDVKAMIEELRERYGYLSYLVNNAGYVSTRKSFEDISGDELHRVFAVNVHGPFFAIKYAVGHMRHLGRGAIVNVSSEAATYGGNMIAAYAASKGAVNSLTKGLARELAASGIRVNAVSPGVIDTRANREETDGQVNGIVESIPFRRMGQPEEVAQVISWLLSDAASYVSGAIVPVAGAR